MPHYRRIKSVIFAVASLLKVLSGGMVRLINPLKIFFYQA